MTWCCIQVVHDNFSDGGYHVPYAHKALDDEIDMSSC
jgi:hypothetical protein